MLARLLFVCMLLFSTGCSNQSIINGAKVESINEASSTELVVVWHTYGDEETRVFENQLLPMFEKEYPHIKIKAVRQAYNDQLLNTLITRASAKQPPDVVRMDMVWVPQFADLNLLYPISKFSDFNQYSKKFYTQAMETNKYQGEYYGLPLNLNTKVAIYNSQQLKKAGLTKPPRTMEEFLAVVKENDYVIGLRNSSAWNSLSYFVGFGGQLTNPQYTKSSGYLNSPGSIQAVQTMLELFKNGNIDAHFLNEPIDQWNGVLQGQYFMIDEGPWFYSILLNDKQKSSLIHKNTVAAPFPVNENKGSVIGGENLVIMKGTRHLQAAWTFIKWMSQTEVQEVMFRTGLIPTNKEAAHSYDQLDQPFIEPYVKGLEQAYLRPPVDNWSKIEKIYRDYLEKILAEEMGVEEGLNKAAKEIDPLLKE
ncbi:carbohydrate ABC transporter substrate-binding protein (CUT1 family) [Melghirimyces profundicolus]|uniref:Carbohydrate ABC transporter substrate-binding protein (CUT1 family) n=1 Tax=Melghirimyces profundicolus TaxID=1242148 RepID=A0A2T6BZ36_9BACL|nr:extracellular solute-binding protein [Melghirimyces profundicolus]PTX61328.1 carbohydrate ABC transporter substrate-binding protein (CUT1 family) [Melghirimyces profundicolus]